MSNESDSIKSVKRRPTKNQMKMLVELLALDPGLMVGKFTTSFTQQIAREKWEAIAFKLNAMSGADKSWEKWKKAWHDLKAKAKAKNKAALIKRHGHGTGGGPPSNIKLTEIQTDAVAQISSIAVSGHKQSQESIVTMATSTSYPPLNKATVNDITSIEISRFDDEPRVSTSYQPLKESVSLNPKQKEKSSGFADTNLATIRHGNLAEKKLALKEAYYSKKLKIMEEQSETFKNINKLLFHFVNSD